MGKNTKMIFPASQEIKNPSLIFSLFFIIYVNEDKETRGNSDVRGYGKEIANRCPIDICKKG
jgi:hypothetical protein